MGDVLTLVEKAQEEIDLADAEKMQEKILTAKFDFTDFLKQMRLLKNMGSLGGIMKLLPGMNKLSDDQLKQGETQLKRCEAMINSMTPSERRDPDLLASSPSRRRRIARGAGYKEADVSKLVSDFQRMRSMMQQMGQGGLPGMSGMFGGMGNPFAGGGNRPPQPGWRNAPGNSNKKAKKKDKKKKGFGTL
jgi:signal recognition particle subunit SRP54